MTDMRSREDQVEKEAKKGCSKEEFRCDFRRAGCGDVCEILLVGSLCERLCADPFTEKWDCNDVS